MVATGSDPRLGRVTEDDVRPVVARERRSLSPWIFGVALALLAIVLFASLDARRRSLSAPATRARGSDLAQAPSSAPPLYVPPALRFESEPDLLAPSASPSPEPTVSASAGLTPRTTRPSPPVSLSASELERLSSIPFSSPLQGGAAPAPPTAIVSRSSPLVFDQSAPAAQTTGAAGMGEGERAVQAVAAPSRVMAGRLLRRETTIAQGTLIPAVLETALDSTRVGQARALVSRDIYGYDRRRLLVPRGSRLFGDYRADLAPGQNRALVQWTRLVRPDGVTIAIDSPATDTLGRAGIRGKVDSHFFERFGSAILQSSLNIATGIAATRVGDNPVILALPNNTIGSVATPGASQQVQPTLRVRAGTRVAVLVARDLDFSGVEARR